MSTVHTASGGWRLAISVKTLQRPSSSCLHPDYRDSRKPTGEGDALLLQRHVLQRAPAQSLPQQFAATEELRPGDDCEATLWHTPYLTPPPS